MGTAEAREVAWRIIAVEDPTLADRLDVLLAAYQRAREWRYARVLTSRTEGNPESRLAPSAASADATD